MFAVQHLQQGDIRALLHLDDHDLDMDLGIDVGAENSNGKAQGCTNYIVSTFVSLPVGLSRLQNV